METLAEKVLSLMEPHWNVTIYGKVEFKISKHLSNNSSYDLHPYTGLFFFIYENSPLGLAKEQLAV